MIKKGSWIFDGSTIISRVKAVNDDGSYDMVLYDRDGKSSQLEPCCGPERWIEIEKPNFPLSKFNYLDKLVFPIREESPESYQALSERIISGK